MTFLRVLWLIFILFVPVLIMDLNINIIFVILFCIKDFMTYKRFLDKPKRKPPVGSQ